MPLRGKHRENYTLNYNDICLDKGVHFIVPNKEGYNYTFSPDTTFVNTTEPFNVVNFIATHSGPPLHSITGRIVDTEGNGVEPCYISLSNEKNYPEYYTTNTDTDGFYTIYGLRDGSYILYTSNNLDSTVEQIIVDGEDIIMPELIVSYRNPTKYVFSGAVLDNDGKGIPDVNIFFTSMHGELQTNMDGLYSTGENNYLYPVSESEMSRQFYFIPSKSGFSFTPDTTWATIEWQEGVEFAEHTVPDIIGFDWGAFNAEDYFPLGTGSSWTYERTTDEGEPTDHTVSVTGTENVNDKTYSLMSSGHPDYFSAFRIENNNAYTLAENGNKAYLKFGVERGSKWAITSIRGKILSATFIDIETVEIPAGTFEDCLHYELNLPLGDISYEKTDLWFARDVGLVKAEKVVVSTGEVMETVMDKLKECDVK